MTILVLKWLHVLFGFVFLGTGGGSAWYKLRAWRSGDARVVAWCDREIVRADWIFTVPSGALAPATGLWLAHLYGLPLSTPWLLWALGGWAVAGIAWLPAAALQVRMRRVAEQAAASGAPLPPAYDRMQRAWMALGVPSFAAAVFVVWVMIAKRAW